MRPLCRPPPLPPAPSADPRAPALAFPGADWPVGVTCKGGGGGEPQRLHLRSAPGCGAVQKTPQQAKSRRTDLGKCQSATAGRGASPAAVLEVDSVCSFAQGQLYSGAPFSYLLPPPSTPSPTPSPTPASWWSGSSPSPGLAGQGAGLIKGKVTSWTRPLIGCGSQGHQESPAGCESPGGSG